MKLNTEAYTALVEAKEKGITTVTESELTGILLNQEIVTYANQNGQITFDYMDLECFDDL